MRQEDAPSSSAENLYWLGRYTVRCEVRAQLLRATVAARLNNSLYGIALKFCRELGLPPSASGPVTSLGDDAVRGILADVRRLAKCASHVRDRLSTSYWHTVAELQRLLSDRAATHSEARDSLDRLLMALAAATGLALDDMRQDQGWRLLSVGRRIERLQFCAQLLSHYLSGPLATQQAHVEWLLSACDSLRIYRPRYAVAPRLGPMLDLLVRDAEHPRSVSFQCQALAQDLTALGRHDAVEARESLGEPLPSLSDADLLALESAEAAPRLALARALRAQSDAAERLSDRLSMRYFSHTRLDRHALAS